MQATIERTSIEVNSGGAAGGRICAPPDRILVTRFVTSGAWCRAGRIPGARTDIDDECGRGWTRGRDAEPKLWIGEL